MKELLLTGTTKRYHVVPGIEQTVAEHSWGVAMIILALHPAPSCKLVRAALTHDCAEKYTGDLPATAKVDNRQLKIEMDRVEEHWLRELGVEAQLDEFDAKWLKTADTMELVLFCQHCVKLGNQYAQEIMDRGLQYLNDARPLPTEVKVWMTAHGYWC